MDGLERDVLVRRIIKEIETIYNYDKFSPYIESLTKSVFSSVKEFRFELEKYFIEHNIRRSNNSCVILSRNLKYKRLNNKKKIFMGNRLNKALIKLNHYKTKFNNLIKNN